MAITSSRQFVSLTHWYNRILFLALLSAIFAVAVWRSRRLLRRPIASEAARTNLSHYFSPNGSIGLPQETAPEFAVFGDTVYVASRLERLTRQVGSPLGSPPRSGNWTCGCREVRPVTLNGPYAQSVA